jgi:hypothetical protein
MKSPISMPKQLRLLNANDNPFRKIPEMIRETEKGFE